MKKAVFAATLIAISSGLVGCGGDSDSGTPAPSAPPTAADVQVNQPQNTAAVTPPPAGATAPEAPVAPPPGTPATSAPTGPGLLNNVEAEFLPHLVNLNNAYQSFRSIEMRSPKDLNELVTAKRLDQLPPTPPGKKYKIDEPNLRIIIVNE
ncbi:MAG TPA: hypothetical protein VGH19_21255 [Verrucomicrobiae bacterium]